MRISRNNLLLATAIACAFALSLLAAAGADGAVTYKQTIGVGGEGALAFSEPAGVAINNTTGDVYVADRQRARIQELTAAGSFVRMWGYDVVSSGEDNKPFANEKQAVKVTGTGGRFRLKLEGDTTGGFGTGTLTSGSPEVSSVITASGTGDVSLGTTTISNWGADVGQWEIGQRITGPGIPAGTTITGVNFGQLQISQGATASTTGATLISPGPFPFAVGQTIVGSGIPAGTTILAAGEGTLTLSQNATSSGSVGLSSGIPYNASAAEVATALNALPRISAGGGAVSVTGGPGDATGSHPYVVSFDTGPVAGKNVAKMTLEGSGLGTPVGAQLSCTGKAPSAEPRGFFEYQWLSNGQEIAGATSSTYTTVAADAGKSIQCRVAATFDISQLPSTILNVSSTFHVVAPLATPSPPEAPLNPLATPNEFNSNPQRPVITGATLVVGGAGGPLTCNAGSWSETPTSYTYQWFSTGKPLGAPVTTSSPSNERIFSAADVSQAAGIQCQITVANAGGASTRMTNVRMTNPGLSGSGVDSVEFPEATMELASGVDPVVTTTDGGPVFEVCQANPPSTDVCKAGVPGPNTGQFDRPRGVAVDNSPGGNGAVYVGDDVNYRIQKFTSTGTPILMWGKHADKTTGGTICTVASGDACGAGLRNLDATTGVFGGWPTSNEQASGAGGEFAELGNTVSVSSGTGEVYVTDPYAMEPGSAERPARVQKFSSSGAYLGHVRTSQFSSAFLPLSVAADSVGDAYVVGSGEQRSVAIFGPSEFTPEGTEKPFLERNTFEEDQEPKQIAVDPNNDDKIWVTDRAGADPCGIGATSRRAILAFDHEGHQLDCSSPEEAGALVTTSGMAISPSGFAYIAVKGQNRIKVYELPKEVKPTVGSERVSNITTETAKVRAVVNPGFERTTYKLQYGTADCASNPCTEVDGGEALNGLKDLSVTVPIDELTPGTQYHYRVVAVNAIGTFAGPDQTFKSFPFVDLVNDPCSNVLPRKQTRASGLLDCRAYELASADFTGGYDVVSDLAPGATPFIGYPHAQDKVLYAVRDGGIPGTGNPTNRGPDPYVATRGPEGWSTKYVGIPADGTPSASPFSSTVGDADGSLGTFAFAGPEICSPCFADGSSGVPLHLPDGSLVQGMKGSSPQLSAVSSGYIGDRLSEDGAHLVFGSTSPFENAGNTNGDLTIYDRNLTTKTTQVVSTMPNGSTMTGAGIGEVDMSDDGTRIVVGKKVSTDAKGNSLWHLYMHVGNSPNSVDLTPTTTTGVLYGGMSADGSKVFFSTIDKLVGTDTDNSADVYEADVSGSSASLSLVSRKGSAASNSDACTPAGDVPWNKVSGSVQDCSAVVLGGGGGVAADGTIYFISPELLDGVKGKVDQPNLYVLRAGGNPHLVATIDDSTNTQLHPLPGPPKHPSKTLISGLANPQSIAVDEANGDIYVGEQGAGRVSRYTSAGAAKPFSSVQPYITENKITGQSFGGYGESQIAFDSGTASPLKGSLYVTSNGSTVNIYSTTGEQIGTLSGFGEACGVAVDQSDGTVYVGNWPGNIQRFEPNSPSLPLSNADFIKTGINTSGQAACNVGADNKGHVYGINFSSGPLYVYDKSEFTAGTPTVEGSEVTAKIGTANLIPPAVSVYTDPENGDLYVHNESRIVQLNSSLTPIAQFGSGVVGSNPGVAVNGQTKAAYATSGSTIVQFGVEPEKFIAVDNPTVVDAVNENDVRHFGDFQTTPDGFALFSTKVRQSTEYDNVGFNMVYRYDPTSEKLDCTSCLSTEGLPTGDATLPGFGLGITDDKRVFFNSPDQLVMRDTNGKLDAYEWKNGEISLISTGFSTHPSSMLGVTANGKDAFFFTRETLVPRDANGQAMKLYDAREGGGFFIVPPSPPCAASDECHGPGTEAAPPPPIGSLKGAGGQEQPAPVTCKKGQVKKKGKCVKKKKPKKHGKNKKKGKKNGHRARAANDGRGGSR